MFIALNNGFPTHDAMSIDIRDKMNPSILRLWLLRRYSIVRSDCKRYTPTARNASLISLSEI